MAKTAENSGEPGERTINAASAGPSAGRRPRWQVYDIAGTPLLLARTSPDAPTTTAELAPFEALDLGLRLIDAARRRLARGSAL